MFRLMYFIWVGALLGVTLACNNSGAPIDADTRKLIDSLSTAQIQTLKIRSDSVCTLSMSTQLPKIVDSLRTLRLQQIDQKLQSIPGNH